MSNKQDNRTPNDYSEEPKGFVTVTYDKKEAGNNQSGKTSQSSPKPSESPKR